MSDSSQQNSESRVIPENTGVSMNWGTGNKSKDSAASSRLQKDHSLPICKKKILDVRQQLAEGTYDIDGRLNTVLDRILEDILV